MSETDLPLPRIDNYLLPSKDQTISFEGKSKREHRLLTTAIVLAVGSVLVLLIGLYRELGYILYPLAFAFGLAAYGCLARWLSGLSNRSKFLQFAERIRQALAYEGDPAIRGK